MLPEDIVTHFSYNNRIELVSWYLGGDFSVSISTLNFTKGFVDEQIRRLKAGSLEKVPK